PVQDPSTPDGDNAAFRLKRESYNSVTASQVTMSILCKYDPKGRHVNVADAMKHQSIISVAGELVLLKRSVYRKLRNKELEKLVEKFSPPPNKNQSRNITERVNDDPQEESSSRAKRLKLAIDEINEVKDKKAEDQQNAVVLTRSDEPSHAKVETDTDGLYSDEEQPNNLDNDDDNTP
ncbi:11138_t:CDS:2, partial [Racocetra fulgida]